MPCIYFDRDDMKNIGGKDTKRCLPNGFWTAAAKAKNVGAKCFGDYGDECQKSCSGAPPDRHWGAPLLLALAASATVYLAAGVSLGRRAGKTGGMAAHIHYSQWIEGVSLVRDGLSLATRRGRGSRGQAASAYAAARASVGVEGKPRQAHKSNKKQTSRKLRKAQAAVVEASHARTLDEGLLSASAASRPAEKSTAQRLTPAGDGGRWVHVVS